MSKPKIDMIRVDRTEHEAYKEAAERANFEIAKLAGDVEQHKLLRAKADENYQACLSINKEQAARLNSQDLQLTDVRAKLAACEREVSRLNKELDAANAELAQLRPAKFNVGPQPAIGGRR